MTKKLEIARHEAAHAVAAWRTGAVIQNVTISGPMNGHKTPNYCAITYPKAQDLDIRDMLAALMCDLAGACIEPNPANISYAGLNDVYQFMRFVTWGGPITGLIAENARALMEKNADSWERSAQEFFNQYRPMAADAVTDDPGRFAVDKLSRLLLTRGRLTGFETVSYLEKTWPDDPPPAALPAQKHPTGLRAGTSPKDAIEGAKRLCRIAFNILSEHGEACEDAAKVVLNALFQLEGF